MRVVITHDFMETYGGAERVTQEMAAAFPQAPVITLLARPAVASRMGVTGRLHSILPPRPSIYRHYRLLTPAYGLLVDRYRLPPADVVLSSSYAFAHRLRARGAAHVCYCHSPLRFAWSMTESYRARWAEGRLRGAAFELLAAAVRRGDVRGARGIDTFLTQSAFTAEQIERFYGRRAEVIGAPVDCRLFRPTGATPDGFFLVAGRVIEPYKRVGLAIEAFRRMPARQLVVAGDGPDLAALRASAPSNVLFTGHLEDHALVEVMGRCRALLFPSRDDFGLMPLEAMACGRPVLAYAAGGALQTVVPGLSGAFIDAQTPEAVVAAVEAFRDADFDPARVRAYAEYWDSPRFRERLITAVRNASESHTAGGSG